MTAISFAHATDVGRIRDHNEDACGVIPGCGLYIVADGMGGHAAGEVASTLAIESISVQVRRGVALVAAIEAAHNRVLAAAQAKESCAGMGCTVVALQFDGADYRIAWVGDSRAYLWDGTNLSQLTRDHSFVQQLLDSGAIDEQQARNHPQNSVLTQALGHSNKKTLQVDVVSGRLEPGQKILLCSDGLSGELNDRDIAGVLRWPGNETETVGRLIRAANKHGGSDNISVVLVAAPPTPVPAEPAAGQVKQHYQVVSFIPLLPPDPLEKWLKWGGLGVALALLVGGLYWFVGL